jgi:hypothetical protein
LSRIVPKQLEIQDPIPLNIYVVGDLPSASNAGEVIFMLDEVGGPIPAFADGTNWRRVTDREIVS